MLSISIIILSMQAPVIAAKICSTVWISALFFFKEVLLSVERLSISALISGFPSKSVSGILFQYFLCRY